MVSMEKNVVQTSQNEPVKGAGDDMHCAESFVEKTVDVDLNRRRFFLPRHRLDTDQPEVASALKNVPADSEPEDSTVKTVLLKDAMVALVRRTSLQSLLTPESMFLELFADDPLLVVDGNGEMLLLEAPASMDVGGKRDIIGKTMQALLSDEAFEDVVEIAGQKGCYYYSARSMSSNYAKLLMLVEEKDRCAMVAEVVRFECITYPRPYAVEMLAYAPFFMPKDEVDVAVAALKEAEGCEDILPVRASNDALYLYSSEHMTYGMAKGLCEWIEVEQFANP